MGYYKVLEYLRSHMNLNMKGILWLENKMDKEF